MLADALRQFWLPGIQNTPILAHVRLSDWVGGGQYYFDEPVGPDSAIFVLTPGVTLHGLYASEVSRFAAAAFETATQMEKHNALPQSLGWLIIQSYYSAYFSAHALFRAVGISCTQFDGNSCAKIGEIATALGMLDKPVNVGSYICEYKVGDGNIVSTRRKGSGGVHEDFWKAFHSFLVSTSNKIVDNASLPTEEAQSAAAHLAELASILTLQGCNGGNWLSMIRNQVNYRQDHRAWFPDWEKKSYCDKLFRIQLKWRTSPESVGLVDADELSRFLRACSFLVSLCRVTVVEIVRRSGTQRSLLKSVDSRFLRPI